MRHRSNETSEQYFRVILIVSTSNSKLIPKYIVKVIFHRSKYPEHLSF